jgi:8-oxo-dGTP pyrophosphatase MutT (NUDIX family)
MSGSSHESSNESFEDLPAPRTVSAREVVMRGRVWDVVRDEVDLGDAGSVTREYVKHPGAVAVLALDDRDRVFFVRQYRHPVRMELWELPAGLLDVVGEDPVTAARRELLEEADLKAERWDLLVDWFNSPGGMDEALRLFLARDVSIVEELHRHVRTEEEAGMVGRWVPFEEALEAVLDGRLHNPGTVVGMLALNAARQRNWTTLRPADEPWPHHPRLAGW